MKENNDPYYTKRLLITKIREVDLEEVRNLHNEPSVLNKLSDSRFVSIEMQHAWFKSLEKSNSSFRFVCREIKTGDLVGVFRIDNFDQLNKSVMIGLDILKGFRRQGYATEIYIFFMKYFYEEIGFHRLYLNTLENNKAARNLYKKLGFRKEGKLIDAIFRKNKYQNLVCYYKLRDF
jgi:RimJ/RimL family protein N-acetyltransferase